MKKLSLILMILIVAGFATLAQAQATRTWVSGVGDDVNPCSRTAPCKTFAGAISKTASPGIINCLDPGGFGAVTITKSITIDCTGTMGSVLHSGVQGIVINALSTDKIVLRAIDINGAGTTIGTNGVNIIQAAAVELYNDNIATDSGSGILASNSSTQIFINIENCAITNTVNGFLSSTTSTGSTLTSISRSNISNNTKGIDLEGVNSNDAQVFNTVISHNSSDGYKAGTGSNGGSIESSSIAFNGNGVNAVGTVRLSRNMIHANFSNGVTGAGSSCFGSNVIDGNVGSNTCTLNNQTVH